MLRKLFETLPFIHHQPPLTMALRKAVVMSLQRPVNLNQIEKYIADKYTKSPEQTLINLEDAITYLRKERFFKRDSSNLFVASLRGICSVNVEAGIEFGFSKINEIPDTRATRTLTTYLCRQKRFKEALELLNKTKESQYTKDTREKILTLIHPDEEEVEEDPIPWAFKVEDEHKLSKSPFIIKHRLDIESNSNIEGLTPEFELVGTIKIAKFGKPSDALVSFSFFDQDMELLNPAMVKGLTFSANVGWYSYLRQDNETGEFLIPFELPDNCVFVHTGFRIWHAKSSVKLMPKCEIKPSSINQFEIDFARFMSNVEMCKSDELVFMFSGTTYVQDVRANRPIRLTKDLLKRDIPVIFNYHRWRRTDEHPEYDGSLLFQIPIDVTKQFMARLANLKTSKKKIFIVSYPHPVIPKILNRFKVNGWMNIYDARDDWEEFQKVGQAKWYSSANEKYIVRNCDHVTAVSWPLAKKLDAYDPIENVGVVPNALSPNFLSDKYRWKGTNKGNKIGYFGHLTSSWFDWDSLIEIAKMRPKYYFEIIGHSAPDDLDLPKNIELMGPKSHPEINKIAAEWNVAIIPFKTGLLADAVDPIKIYEYMALDLPTVSFRMPQIDDYPYTLTVENVEEFCFALDEYTRYRPKKGVLKKWLAKNQWSDRIDEFLRLSKIDRKDGIAQLGVEIE